MSSISCTAHNYVQTQDGRVCSQCAVIEPELVTLDDEYTGNRASRTLCRTNTGPSQQVKYIQAFCIARGISPEVTQATIETMLQIFYHAKQLGQATKRARCRDGLIVQCLFRSLRGQTPSSRLSRCTLKELAEHCEVDPRYVYRADRVMLRLGVLDVDNTTSCSDMMQSIESEMIEMSPHLFDEAKAVMQWSQHHDILLNHTPKSVALTCLLYVLATHGVDIDMPMFVAKYQISHVTLKKALQKLRSARALAADRDPNSERQT